MAGLNDVFSSPRTQAAVIAEKHIHYSDQRASSEQRARYIICIMFPSMLRRGGRGSHNLTTHTLTQRNDINNAQLN